MDISGPNSVTTGDLNGDGFLDVIVTAPVSDQVVWFQQVANGFVMHEIASLQVDVRYAYPVDLDGDGDLDVVTVSMPGFVLWYDNDGTGQFTANIIDTDLAGAIHVTAGDVDGDGDQVGFSSAM